MKEQNTGKQNTRSGSSPPHPYPPSSYNPLRLPEPSTECYFQNSEKSEFISYLQDPPAVYS